MGAECEHPPTTYFILLLPSFISTSGLKMQTKIIITATISKSPMF